MEMADADFSFANSIVPILQSLPAQKTGLAKTEIQLILMKFEFDNEAKRQSLWKKPVRGSIFQSSYRPNFSLNIL